MTDIFRTAGCTCSTTNGLRAALEGKSQGLCPVHHAPQIQAQEAAREQYASEAEAARLHEYFERTTARIAQQQAVRAAAQAAATRAAQVDAIADPLERALTVVTDDTLQAGRSPLDDFRDRLYGTANPDNPDGDNAA